MAELSANHRLLQGQGRLDAHGRPGQGHVPAVAIVGGSVPMATGMALAFKMQKSVARGR